MGNRAIVGTPIRVVIDGFLFYPAADADPSHGRPGYKTEAIKTTGRTIFRMIDQTQEITGLTIKVTDGELTQLKGLAERIEPYPMSYTNAAESTYKATGKIDYDDRKAQSGTVELVLYPDENGWEEI